MSDKKARKGKKEKAEKRMSLILEFPPVNASEFVVTYAFVAASHDALHVMFKFKSAAFAAFSS